MRLIGFLGSSFWILTYILIVVGGFKFKDEKLIFMPLISGALNFAWEINALVTSGGYWVHVAWLALDVLIILQNLRVLFSIKRKYAYIYMLGVISSIILFNALFSIKAFDGMLISSYALNLLISIEYLLCIKKISPHWLTLIGVCRLLGDLFTWIVYIDSALFVTIIGVFIFVVNLFYIFYTLELANSQNEKNKLKKR